jgi:hypothetical protein
MANYKVLKDKKPEYNTSVTVKFNNDKKQRTSKLVNNFGEDWWYTTDGFMIEANPEDLWARIPVSK